jgi:signal transduction histidine kinase
VVTVLLVSYLALRNRERAEHERLAALRSQDERDQARAASELKTMFIRLVSHELLTPLQSIQLNVEGLVRKPDAPASQRLARQQRVTRAARRLTDLVDSILELARSEVGQLRPAADDIELAGLAAEVVEDLRGEAAEKHLALAVRVGPEVPPLRSDAKLVRLALSNLLTNALKYTTSGGVTVRVGHGAEGHRLEVEDTGPGIAPEDRERIFEPFTQLETLDRKHVKGVGLGLTLVRQMATSLGARIELTSTVGVGSCFSIVFPSVSLSRVA